MHHASLLRRCFALAALGLVLLLAGCGTDAAARVNGEVITRAEYSHSLHGAMQLLSITDGVDWSSDPRAQAALPRLSGLVLDNLITTRLLRQQAKADGIVVGAGEIDTRIAQMIEQAGGREAFLDRLAAFGLTSLALREQVNDTLLRERLIERHVPAPTEIEARRVRHVMLDTPEQAAAARARLAAGERWETVAAEASLDPGTKGSGGDLGYLQHGQTLPAFDEAAFALAPNELSGVVATQFGYHILMVTEVLRQPVAPEQVPALQQEGL